MAATGSLLGGFLPLISLLSEQIIEEKAAACRKA